MPAHNNLELNLFHYYTIIVMICQLNCQAWWLGLSLAIQLARSLLYSTFVRKRSSILIGFIW